MVDKLKFPALDGYVLIGNDTASVMNDDELVIQVSIEEWELLREKFRFDDTVDYERGETQMTGYQLRSCLELLRENKKTRNGNPATKR